MRAFDIVAMIDTMSVVIKLICIGWLVEHSVYSNSDSVLQVSRIYENIECVDSKIMITKVLSSVVHATLAQL